MDEVLTSSITLFMLLFPHPLPRVVSICFSTLQCMLILNKAPLAGNHIYIAAVPALGAAIAELLTAIYV